MSLNLKVLSFTRTNTRNVFRAFEKHGHTWGAKSLRYNMTKVSVNICAKKASFNDCLSACIFDKGNYNRGIVLDIPDSRFLYAFYM